jgi:hypothetical protein
MAKVKSLPKRQRNGQANYRPFCGVKRGKMHKITLFSLLLSSFSLWLRLALSFASEVIFPVLA